MNIGIIGAGHIGGGLATKLVRLGHSVLLANSRGANTLTEVAAKTGARAVEVAAAVNAVDLVIVTIPQKAIPALAGVFRDVPGNVVVVETGNYYPTLRDGRIPALERGDITESEWVAEQLGRPVLKVFNNIMAVSLAEGGKPKGAPDRIALPLAGDQGKPMLFELVDALGFDPVDGGAIADSWRQEPGTPAYCTDLGVADLAKALAAANRDTKAAARDAAIQHLLAHPGLTHAEMVQMARDIVRVRS